MIQVTRLDGTPLLINVDQVESIEQTPDTIVSLVNGHKILTRESPEEIVARIVAYKQRVEGHSPADVTPHDTEPTTGRRSR